ncbi:hypothetical protein [Gallaecimonas sp. GXIMD4217]|uniref:hypothetical protein n=1 Tax=Gallaecimonas sp. GXIMD4217 TaxID=3131927 RepID=UPI00311B0296
MNIDKILEDPSRRFESPEAVCDEEGLTLEQKIHILRQWEYDARELAVAEEENMAGGPDSRLDRILAAIRRLEKELGQG